MRSDARGLQLSTDQDAAATGFDNAVAAHLSTRTGLARLVKTMLHADPDFALGHCLDGIGAILAYDGRMVPAAATAPGATSRAVRSKVGFRNGHKGD
jgi:hypothetical protein